MGSKSDFFSAGNCHPTVKWAEEDPEVTPEELAKVYHFLLYGFHNIFFIPYVVASLLWLFLTYR